MRGWMRSILSKVEDRDPNKTKSVGVFHGTHPFRPSS
jgi:hypothetical protein